MLGNINTRPVLSLLFTNSVQFCFHKDCKVRNLLVYRRNNNLCYQGCLLCKIFLFIQMQQREEKRRKEREGEGGGGGGDGRKDKKEWLYYDVINF